MEELIRTRPGHIEALYALAPWLERHREALPGLQEGITEVTPQELKKLSGLHTPNQVLALVRLHVEELDAGRLAREWTLFLDGIRDPGNLGTILRIADWFGISCVCCSPDCVDQFNPKVIQASMGAFLRVDCIVSTLAELRQVAGPLPILGADLSGENLFQIPLPARGIVVIGSEAHGISPEVQEQLTHRIRIPRGAGGGAESLNAAVATGIICAVLQNRS